MCFPPGASADMGTRLSGVHEKLSLTVSRTLAPISFVESTVKPCGLRASQVRGAEALFKHLAHGGLDGRCFGFEAAGVAQDQRAGENCAERIGQALAGDVGRGAVDRLVQD